MPQETNSVKKNYLHYLIFTAAVCNHSQEKQTKTTKCRQTYMEFKNQSLYRANKMIKYKLFGNL
jgi:hypothetical protein